MAETKVKFIDVRYNEAAATITFIMGNGVRTQINLDEMPEHIRKAAMYHGFNQKIRDSAAGFSKEKDYAGALEAMDAVIIGLSNGFWNRKGGATGAGFTVEDIANAIATFKKVPFEKALAAVEKATEENRKKWLENETVKAYAQKAKADRMVAAAAGGAGSEDVEIEGLGDE